MNHEEFLQAYKPKKYVRKASTAARKSVETLAQKAMTSERLQRDVEQFIKNGGVVLQIKFGQSAYSGTYEQPKLHEAGWKK